MDEVQRFIKLLLNNIDSFSKSETVTFGDLAELLQVTYSDLNTAAMVQALRGELE